MLGLSLNEPHTGLVQCQEQRRNPATSCNMWSLYKDEKKKRKEEKSTSSIFTGLGPDK